MRYIIHRKRKQEVIRASECGLRWIEEPKRTRRIRHSCLVYDKVCDGCGKQQGEV